MSHVGFKSKNLAVNYAEQFITNSEAPTNVIVVLIQENDYTWSIGAICNDFGEFILYCSNQAKQDFRSVIVVAYGISNTLEAMVTTPHELLGLWEQASNTQLVMDTETGQCLN